MLDEPAMYCVILIVRTNDTPNAVTYLNGSAETFRVTKGISDLAPCSGLTVSASAQYCYPHFSPLVDGASTCVEWSVVTVRLGDTGAHLFVTSVTMTANKS